jgi:hypothetical protein
MGSGTSGLYTGTYGARQSRDSRRFEGQLPPHSERAMRQCVTRWASAEREGLSKTQRNKFNTACLVYDCVTGKRYYGRNNGIRINDDEKNPILFGGDGTKGILPAVSLNHLEVGRCAEVAAVNKALNEGANLKNLYMMTVHTRTDMFGEPKKACENCTHAFKGRVKENYAGWSMEV